MRSPTKLGAALAALALVVVLAPAALAQTTTMYPTSDSISAGSAPIAITGLGTINCTYNGGSFKAPASGSSGAVSLNFTTLPTFTGCTYGKEAVTATTSNPFANNPWSITFEYGKSTVSTYIPAEGLVFKTAGGQIITPKSAITLSGAWDNGFTSPVSVSSALDVFGSATLNWYGANTATTFGPTLVSLTDVTHPASLPLLGP